MAEGIGLEIRQVGSPARGFKSPLLREKKDLKRSFFRGENDYPSAGPGAGQNRRSAACGRKSEAILVTSSEKATDEGSFFVDDGGAAKQFKSPLLREERVPSGALRKECA